MELSNEQIAGFQELYEDQFGIRLDKKQALNKALELLDLMSIVHKPITKDQLLKHRSSCDERDQINKH